MKKERSNNRRMQKYSVKLELSNIDWDKFEKIFSTDRQLLIKQINNKRKNRISVKQILKLLAGGAVLGMSFMVPSLPKALAPYILDGNKYNRSLFTQTLGRLQRQKLVQVTEDKNCNTLVKITDKGRLRVLRYKLSDLIVKQPKVWDKKWRVVIFDIPEKYKRMREIFRRHLQLMGFYMLQKSVWIHPYPCFNEIEFLRQIYQVGVDVTYLVAEKVEGYQDLKEYFLLK